VKTSRGGDRIASAPHKSIAVKFLEYMARDAAQNIIANANCELPAVAGVSTTPELKALARAGWRSLILVAEFHRAIDALDGRRIFRFRDRPGDHET
jgi:ABC-type thiamine transport system substrate-binding protein